MATATTTQVFESAMQTLGLEPRPQQQKLVNLVRPALQSESDTVLVQAGTGTGKSYGVMALAIEAHLADPTHRPALVICPTNRLIDQYIIKDAPKIAKATGARIEYIKGRNRYLCAESYGFETKFGRAAREEFEKMTKDGRFEWAQHYGLDETFGCDGNCSNDASVCAVQLARGRAAGAAVIVTNGHMAVYDQLIRDWTDNQARLLPDYCALFVDECHELEAVARGCLSDQIGPNAQIYKTINGLKTWVMSQITEAGLSEDKRELAVDYEDPYLIQMSDEASVQLARMLRKKDTAETQGDRSLLKAVKKDIKALQRLIEFATPADENSTFVSTISVEPDQSYPGGLKPYLNRICIDASQLARDIISEQPSALVSGTIPPSLSRRLGVRNASFHDVGTPFDYSKSQLCISGFTPKSRNDLTPRLLEAKGAILDMANRSHEEGGGGTLILVTSWRDLDLVASFMAQNLPRHIPVLTQHRTDAADTAEMLEEFIDHGHAVLVGVRTFWTGLDIPGDALRQVIIWKAPYEVPTIEMEAIQARFGRDVYRDMMVQTLAQGIGRLVRTHTDTGRVLISDSRLKSFAWSANQMTANYSSFMVRRG